MDYGIGEKSSDSGRFPVLGMVHVGRGEISGTADGFVDSVPEELLLEPGDLLFNRTNSLPLVGKVGIFRGRPGTTTFASYLVRLRTAPDFDPHFLNYLLNTDEVLGLVRSMALPSIGQANLNPNRYSQIRIWVPKEGEQRRIAASLDRTAAEVHRSRTSLARQMELLRERRQALITAAVTGEIDVTGLVA